MADNHLARVLISFIYENDMITSSQQDGRGGVVVSLGTVDPLSRVRFPVPALR